MIFTTLTGIVWVVIYAFYEHALFSPMLFIPAGILELLLWLMIWCLVLRYADDEQ